MSLEHAGQVSLLSKFPPCTHILLLRTMGFVKVFLEPLWHFNPSSYSIYISPYITPSLSFFHPCFPLRLCVSVPVAGQCCCVSVDVRQTINLWFAGGGESRCMWLYCTTRCFGLCSVWRSLIQHPHWSVCRSAVNTVASLSPFLIVEAEDSPLCPSPTDWMSDFQLSPCSAVLAERLLSVSPSHRSIWCRLPVIHLLASPSFCLQQHLVSRRRCSSACKYLCVSLSLLLPSYPLTSPSGATWTMKMWSVPRLSELFFLSTLTPPLPHSPVLPLQADSFIGASRI